MKGIDLNVPVGQEVKIEIRKPGYQAYIKRLTISPDEVVVNVRVPELKRVTVGLLSTSSNYTSGSKIIFNIGEFKFEKNLPLKNERVPAGNYEATIVNPLLGTEKKINFNVEENKKTFLE